MIISVRKSNYENSDIQNINNNDKSNDNNNYNNNKNNHNNDENRNEKYNYFEIVKHILKLNKSKNSLFYHYYKKNSNI